MGLILTATGGLIVWLVLWAIRAVSGFNSIMIGIAVFLLAIAVHGVLPYLPGRR